MHSCNRDEIAETSLEDNECKDECTRVHECSSVQTGLALDNPMNSNGKSSPVARVHGFSEGYEEEECAVDSVAAIEPSPCSHNGGNDADDDPLGIPPFLRRAYQEEFEARAAHEVRPPAISAGRDDNLDDLTIPPCLDRRHETCAWCGQPGGTEWDYRGLTVRLHERCEHSWVDAYEAGSNGRWLS